MNLLKKIFSAFSPDERKWFFAALAILVLSAVTSAAFAIEEDGVFVPIAGGSFREGFLGQPIALNPVTSGNPVDQEISEIVFGRLSDLLAAYDVSSDGRSYSLKLKEGLKWDDGQPLTSDDVIFTIKTIQNPDVRSPLLKSWQGVAAERGSELQIKLTLPLSYVFFINNIERLSIIPKHIFGNIPTENFRLSDYNLEPVGSGPYKFKDFTKRKDGFISQYHFIPNENYVGEKPYIKDFYFDFFQNRDDVYRALKLHEINGFGGATPIDFDSAQFKGLAAQKIPLSDYYAVFFNQNSNPLLKDQNVRNALISAVDKDQIIKEVLSGNGTNIDAPGFTSTSSITGDNSSFDQDSARQSVNAFKIKNKNEQIVITLSVPDVEFLKDVAEVLKDSWQNVGVDQVNIVTFNPSDPTDATIKSRNYEMLLFGNILENPVDIFPFWHSSQKLYPGSNLALYQNLKVDNLIETIRQTSDPSKQSNLLTQAQSTIMNEQPAVFLFSLPYTYIHTKDLGGFNENFLTSPAERFKDVSSWYVAQVLVIK